MNNGYIDEEGKFVGPEETVYINDAQLYGGLSDTVLILSSNSPRGTERKLNIMLSPTVLKAISKLSSEFVDYYENKIGEIPDLTLESDDDSGKNE